MTARALQAPLEELESTVSRRPGEPEDLADAKGAVIKRYGLRHVNLGYAGLFPEGHRIHRAITDARTGDPLTLVENNGKWDIHDAQGRMLGRMAKRFEPPDGSTLAGATVRRNLPMEYGRAGTRRREMAAESGHLGSGHSGSHMASNVKTSRERPVRAGAAA